MSTQTIEIVLHLKVLETKADRVMEDRPTALIIIANQWVVVADL